MLNLLGKSCKRAYSNFINQSIRCARNQSIKRARNQSIRSARGHISHNLVREGNNYRDPLLVGYIVMDRELKRWQNSLSRRDKKNGLEACKKISLAYHTNTANLDLSNLSLNSLPATCIAMLQNLKRINISMNLLTTIKGTGIEKIIGLNDLNLSSNRLVDLSEISKLPNLKSLNISNNRGIKCLSELSMCHKSLLHKLIMHEMKSPINCQTKRLALKKIAAAFLYGDSKLDISNLWLEDIPPCIQLLKNLKTLDISLNSLESAKDVEFLFALKKINVSYNKLTNLNGVDAFGPIRDLFSTENGYKFTSIETDLSKTFTPRRVVAFGNTYDRFDSSTTPTNRAIGRITFKPRPLPAQNHHNLMPEASSLVASMNSMNSSYDSLIIPGIFSSTLRKLESVIII